MSPCPAPHIQDLQTPLVLSGLGLPERRAADRRKPNSWGAGRGPKLPGSKGLFRKRGGVKQGGVGWGRDG